MVFSFCVNGLCFYGVSDFDVFDDPAFDVFDDTRLSLTSSNKKECKESMRRGP